MILLILTFLLPQIWAAASPIPEAAALATARAVILDVARREAAISEALGPYKIYVYEGGAFDEMTTGLLSKAPRKAPEFNEYRAAIWVHRALQHDPSRTMNPAEADLFFVPGYLQLSADLSNTAGTGRGITRPQNEARLGRWKAAVRASPWFKRYNGADHLFSLGDCNPGWAVEHGVRFAHGVMGAGFIGTFEMNHAWAGDWDYGRMIAMPYVASDAIVKSFLGYDDSGRSGGEELEG